MIVCAGDMESIKGAMPIGMGLIEPAVRLPRLIEAKRPSRIIFVGSAGSYGEFKPFEVIESCISSQVEISKILDLSYTPIKETIISNVSCETKIITNSSNYITKDAELAKRYLELGYSLENMEFYSVMYVAKIYNISAKGIFVITNYCNENAHSDFLKNLPKAKKIMEKLVEQNL